MLKRSPIKLICVIACVMITSCTTIATKPDRYSGFLKDYSNLTATTSATGVPVMRWVDPSFKSSNYSNLIFTPITYYPTPKATTQIGQKVLDDLLNYTNTQLKMAAGDHFKLVTKPGARTLIFRGAITGVDTSKQGLQVYEVVPIALLIAGTQAATGHRTMDTNLYFEGEFIDSQTNKTMIKVVRKGTGKQLRNEDHVLTLEDLKKVIENMVLDADAFYLNTK